MLTTDISHFKEQLPKQGRLLGLDVGERKIGLALCDEEWRIASPLEVMLRKNIAKDIGSLKALIREHHITGLVMGLPLHMDGSEGDGAIMVRQFAEKILKKRKIPILLYDERMSTAAVSRTLKESGMNRKKQDTLDDKLAASYILQTVLDHVVMSRKGE